MNKSKELSSNIENTNMNLKKYTCKSCSSILDGLKKIDENKKSFLVVVDHNNNIIGTLTDGDIRRALIRGLSLNETVLKACNKKFIKLNNKDSIGDVIEIFKNSKIKFLPIVNNEDRLVNIITKLQMQSLLLQDINVDLNYDFSVLDENIINTEIFSRPWGFYKTTVLNEYYQSKVITVKPDGQLSLQSHKHRDEYWIIVHGIGKATIEDKEIRVKAGDTLLIPRNVKHRLINIDNKESLIVNEVQLGDYFGEDDITRYSDIYNRV